MQLANVKISNVLSFPYDAILDKSPGIQFSTGEKGMTNILIGPNGSGKSNFLEIINQTVKVGLLNDYVYHHDILKNNKKTAFLQVIEQSPMRLHNVAKHFSFTDQDAEVMITLLFNQNDYDNMHFVCKFYQEINAIIRKYSTLDIQFPAMQIDDLVFENELTLHYQFDFANKTMILQDMGTLTPQQQFMLLYLQNHELIQICMHIYNHYEKATEARDWYPLKNTFAILGSYRNFKNIDSPDNLLTTDASHRNTYISGQRTQSAASLTLGYHLCVAKIRQALTNTDGKMIYSDNDALDTITKKLSQLSFYTTLQEVIRRYLSLELVVTIENNDVTLGFKDIYGHVYTLKQLSSGDKAFLLIILMIFGYDLENGLMIIDEPEIHFHPQMQQKFMQMIEDVSDKYHIQFIIATHSPVMINEHNIERVYRFTRHKLATQVRNAAHKITADEASLIHMLKFENTAKIFFVNKIIMVEGETDAYFFNYYLQYLHNHPDRKTKITQYEIININGKGGYRKRNKFLRKFGLQTYYIGDRDNIVNKNIISDGEMHHFRDAARHYYQSHKHPFGRFYTRLVQAVKNLFPKRFKYIHDSIMKLYVKHIYLLQRGDLETYMGIRTKGLDDTVMFCYEQFPRRINDKSFAKHRQELEHIFAQIFAD